jgi:hypothetical protein
VKWLRILSKVNMKRKIKKLSNFLKRNMLSIAIVIILLFLLYIFTFTVIFLLSVF